MLDLFKAGFKREEILGALRILPFVRRHTTFCNLYQYVCS